MGSLPLHPIIVHLPIALGVLMPFVALATLVAWWRDWLPRGAWVGVVLLQAVLVGGGLAAMETGEDEEDRVETVVAERFIEEHEEAAEVFVWGAGGALAITILALVVPGAAPKRWVALVAVAAMGIVTFLGYRVGEAGGELVYRHGAASAYTGVNAANPTGREHERYDHDDD
jgi:uncharacterized membrane protein